MSNSIKTGAVGVVGALTFGAADVAVLNEVPVERVEMIADERVETRQIGNVVETSFPWKDEAGIKVKYDMGKSTFRERLSDKRSKQVIVETIDFADGGFKIDLILNEKPETNVFKYEIEGWEDYDFHYQPPLSKQNITDVPVYKCTDIECVDREGNIVAEQLPENVGSYAVYHKTLRDNRMGGINYFSGKVMHIPRPQIWSLSASSTKIWGDMSFEDGVLSVVVPQDFLNTAKYPVRVDPTFGYNTVGGSNFNAANFVFLGCYRDTAPEDGTIESISQYVSEAGTNDPAINGALYDDASSPNKQAGQGDETTVDSGAAWYTSTFSGTQPTITSGTTYNICLLGGGTPSFTFTLYRDFVDVDATFIDSGLTYPTFPDPAGTRETTSSYSIYATYSVEERITPQSIFFFN